jgi:two-component system OmpR family response regulator
LLTSSFNVIAVEIAEVREALQRQKPALIIANLSGSQADDLDLCQMLSKLSETPIVAIGSAGDTAFHKHMIEPIVDDFLIRPVNPREVTARVKNILRRTQKLR